METGQINDKDQEAPVNIRVQYLCCKVAELGASRHGPEKTAQQIKVVSAKLQDVGLVFGTQTMEGE